MNIQYINSNIFEFTFNMYGKLIQKESSNRLIDSGVNMHLTENLKLAINKIGRCYELPYPIVLIGNSGCGKTMLIDYVSSKLNTKEPIKLHLANQQIDIKSLIGLYTTTSKPGVFRWTRGPLLKAIEEGIWLVLEDINLISIELLLTIKQVIEQRFIYIPNRNQKAFCKDGFKIFGTIKNEQTNISNIQEIFKNLSIIQLSDYTDREYERIIETESPNLADTIYPQICVKVYNKFRHFQNSSTNVYNAPIDTNKLLKLSKRINKDLCINITDKLNTNELIFKHILDVFCSDFEYEALLRFSRDILPELANFLGISKEISEYYLNQYEPNITKNISNNTVSVGLSILKVKEKLNENSLSLNSKYVDTKYHKLLMEKIVACIEFNEPVLLIGETGTGKTTLIQNIAHLSGNKLNIINMSQQSEVSDLIGSYRPINYITNTKKLFKRFIEIFDNTFSIEKNYNFINTVNKLYKEQRFETLILCFKKSIQKYKELSSLKLNHNDNNFNKKLNLTSNQKIRNDWLHFENDLSIVCNSKNKIAFQFIEGILSKCIQSGEWILLDEINLATVETLSCLTGLLDKKGSLIITDRGDAEPLKKHPDFRIFACMNPGSSVGKSELPLSIRSKFSEIYVFPIEFYKLDLTNIITQYLSNYLFGLKLKHIVNNISEFYYECKTFQNKKMLSDSSGMSPNYSLRTLCRSLDLLYKSLKYLNLDLKSSIKNSFELFFTSSLSNETKNYITKAIKEKLLKDIPNSVMISVKKKDQNTIKYSKLISNSNEEYKSSDYISVYGFFICKGPEVISPSNISYVITTTIKDNIKTISKALFAKNYPILLQGPTSSGKTSMVKYLAQITGNRFIRINNHEHTDLQDYIGSYVFINGNFVFQEGPLITALRKGYWLLLDELNLAPSEVLEALNRLLDDNRELYVPEIDEIIKPHDKFQLFATQNPPGSIYAGRKILSLAFRNRFIELNIDEIPIEELQIILTKSCLIPESYSAQMIEIYNRIKRTKQISNILGGSHSIITLRDLFKWSSRLNISRQELAMQGYYLIVERTRNLTDKENIKQIIEEVTKIKIDHETIYSFDNLLKLFTFEEQLNLKKLKNITWTYSMRRMLYLAKIAKDNKEPILLVGETGCGKTQMCQVLSKILNIDLVILNCHQNTEASDFIGSQRPLRNINQLESEISRKVLTLCENIDIKCKCDHLKSKIEINDKSLLLQNYLEMCNEPNSKLYGLINDLHSSNCLAKMYIDKVKTYIDKIEKINKVCFSWIDGPLVKCMKEGKMFMMDEISLAEDSVLERINSLLEKDPTLYISENTDENADKKELSVVANTSFCLVATMNPGSDFGKKELSPALRNRFTEIWIPTINNDNDLIELISDGLKNYNHIPKIKQYISLSIVEFSKWLKERINATREYENISNPHIFSIRDFLTWTSFINTQSHTNNIEEATLHGLCLMYLDSVGTDGCLYTRNYQIDESRVNNNSSLTEFKLECLNHMCKLMKYNSNVSNILKITNKANDNFEIKDVDNEECRLGIDPFYIHAQKNMFNEDLINIINIPTTKLNLKRILRAMQISKPVLLEGEPGAGKTKTVEILSQLTNNKLIRLNLSEQTDIMDLFGCDLPVENDKISQPKFEWKSSAFVEAIENGDWILIDEINLANQSVLEGLNSCLDHRQVIYIPEIDKVIRPKNNNKKFKIFATMNSSSRTTGRKTLPKSFLNRFTKVYIEVLHKSDLLKIVKNELKSKNLDIIAKNIVEFNSEVSKIISSNNKNLNECNIRDILRWVRITLKHFNDFNFTKDNDINSTNTFQRLLDRFLDIVYLQKIDNYEEKIKLIKIYNLIFYRNQSQNSIKYYSSIYVSHEINKEYVQYGTSKLFKNMDNTLRNFYFCNISPGNNYNIIIKHLIDCINLDWMSILTGSCSIDKTGIIRYVADISNNYLIEYNMTQDTDINDLLGGYDQYDWIRHFNQTVFELDKKLQKLNSTIYNQRIKLHNYSMIDYINISNEVINLINVLEENISINNHRLYAIELNKLIKKFKELLEDLPNNIILEGTMDIVTIFKHLHDMVDAYDEKSKQCTFEWVDGPLLKAIQEGYWFLINNANLGNPSVMDRLLALVEEVPENKTKTFKVHERGLNIQNNQIHEYKVNKKFRLFLIVDEYSNNTSMISRPMRNRGIEIYIHKHQIQEPNSIELIPDFQDSISYLLDSGFSLIKSKSLLKKYYNSQNLFKGDFTLADFVTSNNFLKKTSTYYDFMNIYPNYKDASSINNILYPCNTYIKNISFYLYNNNQIYSFINTVIEYINNVKPQINSNDLKIGISTIKFLINLIAFRFDIKDLIVIKHFDYKASTESMNDLLGFLEVLITELQDASSFIYKLKKKICKIHEKTEKNTYADYHIFQASQVIKLGFFKVFKMNHIQRLLNENTYLMEYSFYTMIYFIIIKCHGISQSVKSKLTKKTIQHILTELHLSLEYHQTYIFNIQNIFREILDFIYYTLVYLIDTDLTVLQEHVSILTKTEKIIHILGYINTIFSKSAKRFKVTKYHLFSAFVLLIKNIYDLIIITKNGNLEQFNSLMVKINEVINNSKSGDTNALIESLIIYPNNSFRIWKYFEDNNCSSKQTSDLYCNIIKTLNENYQLYTQNYNNKANREQLVYKIMSKASSLLSDNFTTKDCDELNQLHKKYQDVHKIEMINSKSFINVFDFMFLIHSCSEETIFYIDYIKKCSLESLDSRNHINDWIEMNIKCGNYNYQNCVGWFYVMNYHAPDQKCLFLLNNLLNSYCEVSLNYSDTDLDIKSLIDLVLFESHRVAQNKITLKDLIQCNYNTINKCNSLILDKFFIKQSPRINEQFLYAFVAQMLVMLMKCYQKYIDVAKFKDLQDIYFILLDNIRSKSTFSDKLNSYFCKMLYTIKECVSCINIQMYRKFLDDILIKAIESMIELSSNAYHVVTVCGFLLFKLTIPNNENIDPLYGEDLKQIIKIDANRKLKFNASTLSILDFNTYSNLDNSIFDEILKYSKTSHEQKLWYRTNENERVWSVFCSIKLALKKMDFDNLTKILPTNYKDLQFIRSSLNSIDLCYSDLTKPLIIGINMMIYGSLNCASMEQRFINYPCLSKIFACDVFFDCLEEDWPNVINEIKTLRSSDRISDIVYLKLIRYIMFLLAYEIHQTSILTRDQFQVLSFIMREFYSRHQIIYKLKQKEKHKSIYKNGYQKNEDLTQEETLQKDLDEHFPTSSIDDIIDNNINKNATETIIYDIELFQIFRRCFSYHCKNCSKYNFDLDNQTLSKLRVLRYDIQYELHRLGIISNHQIINLFDIHNLESISDSYSIKSNIFEDKHSYNFYKSSCFNQLRDVIPLIKQITEFFEGIYNNSMYSTPIVDDLIKFINKITKVKITSPLSCFVSIFDKLICKINEFKIMVTDESSLSEMLELFSNKLQKKVVHLRKHELQSFDCIIQYKLDSEIEKCYKEFWYELYYSLIYSITPYVQTSKNIDLKGFNKKLCTTIHSFLLNSTAGQFSIRLQMLMVVINYYKVSLACTDTNHNIKYILYTLENIYYYYASFEKQIVDMIESEKRLQIKSIRKSVSLTIWKEDNYEHVKSSIHHTQKQIVKSLKLWLDLIKFLKVDKFIIKNYYIDNCHLFIYRTTELCSISPEFVDLGSIEKIGISSLDNNTNINTINSNIAKINRRLNKAIENKSYNNTTKWQQIYQEINDLSTSILQKVENEYIEDKEYITNLKKIKLRALSDLYSKLTEIDITHSHYGLEAFIKFDIDLIAFSNKKGYLETFISKSKVDNTIINSINQSFMEIIFKMMTIRYLKLNNDQGSSCFPSKDFNDKEINRLFSYISSIAKYSSMFHDKTISIKLSLDTLDIKYIQLSNIFIKLLHSKTQNTIDLNLLLRKYIQIIEYAEDTINIHNKNINIDPDSVALTNILKRIIKILSNNKNMINEHISNNLGSTVDYQLFKSINESFYLNINEAYQLIESNFKDNYPYFDLILKIKQLLNDLKLLETDVSSDQGVHCLNDSSNSKANTVQVKPELESCIKFILKSYENINCYLQSIKDCREKEGVFTVKDEISNLQNITQVSNIISVTEIISSVYLKISSEDVNNDFEKNFMIQLKYLLFLINKYKETVYIILNYFIQKYDQVVLTFNQLLGLFKSLLEKGYNLPNLDKGEEGEEGEESNGNSGNQNEGNAEDGCGIDGTDVNNLDAKDIGENIDSEAQINNQDKENLNDLMDGAGDALEAKNQVESECESFSENENSENGEGNSGESENEIENTEGNVDNQENEINIDDNFWNEDISDNDSSDNTKEQSESENENNPTMPEDQNINTKQYDDDKDENEKIDMDNQEANKSKENQSVPKNNNESQINEEQDCSASDSDIDQNNEQRNESETDDVDQSSLKDEESPSEIDDLSTIKDNIESDNDMDIDEGKEVDQEFGSDMNNEQTEENKELQSLENNKDSDEGIEENTDQAFGLEKDDKNNNDNFEQKDKDDFTDNIKQNMDRIDIDESKQNTDKNCTQLMNERDTDFQTEKESPENGENKNDADKSCMEDKLEALSKEEIIDNELIVDTKSEDIENEEDNNNEYEISKEDKISNNAAIDKSNKFNSKNTNEDKSKEKEQTNPKNIEQIQYDIDALESLFRNEYLQENSLDTNPNINHLKDDTISNDRKASIGFDNNDQEMNAIDPLLFYKSQILWKQYESETFSLSQYLGQRLKAILEPNLKSQLKGDYRTGKKLNMRKIIPYLASEYRKDKIWMKREKASKRRYKIIISVDDSYSMAQDINVIHTTFKSVSLLSQALNICGLPSPTIIRFGKESMVVGDENTEKTRYGSDIISSFKFDQNETNLINLLRYGIRYLYPSISTLDYSKQISRISDDYSIMIILSDGIFHNHEETRRLVNYAKANKLIVIFIAIETNNKESTHNKLNEVNNVEFLEDGTIKITNYMDTFPFEYHIVLQDITQMPSVLCDIITQFFNNIKQ